MNSIFTRRSIRRYTAEKVGDDSIKKLLEAAMAAPSAGNERPWHFIVIREKDNLKKISAASPHAEMVPHASAAVLVCCDLSLETHKGYWVQDCAAAVENFLIEAEENRLGAVWVGIYPVKERVEYLKRFFRLSESIVPFALIPVGYPAESFEPQSRYDGSRVHYEKW